MDDNEFIRRLIKKYQRESSSGFETNVTGIVNKIIRITGKDSGTYIVKDEVVLGSIPGTPDKCIFQLIVYHDETLDRELPAVAIECKHRPMNHDKFSSNKKYQLKRYMITAGFPLGWLVSEYKTEFYRLDEDKLNILSDNTTYDNLDNLDLIIETIRN